MFQSTTDVKLSRIYNFLLCLLYFDFHAVVDNKGTICPRMRRLYVLDLEIGLLSVPLVSISGRFTVHVWLLISQTLVILLLITHPNTNLCIIPTRHNKLPNISQRGGVVAQMCMLVSSDVMRLQRTRSFVSCKKTRWSYRIQV